MKLHIELSVTCLHCNCFLIFNFFIITVELACVPVLQLVQEVLTLVLGKIILYQCLGLVNFQFLIIPVELACVALLQLVQELLTLVLGKIILFQCK